MKNKFKKIVIIILFGVFAACNADNGSGDVITATDPLPTHRVTYNGNGSTGGSVPVDSYEHTEGGPVSVLGNTGNLVNGGFSFAGWTTNPAVSGASASYAAGATFTMGTADVILYAVWIPDFLIFTSNMTDIRITGHSSSIRGVLEIPPGVTSISGFSFLNSEMTGITIPSSVTAIESGAFNACPHLAEILVDPSNPDYASLSGVLFDRAMTTLFQVPGALTGSYSIPSGVEVIQDRAFEGSKLSTIIIPSSVTTIMLSFNFCFNLTGITIPASVTSISDSAFFYCTALTGFTVDPENRNYAAYAGVLFNRQMTAIVQMPGAMTGSYSIPSGVTSIRYGVFTGSALTDVFIPSSVTSISESAFTDCQSLTSIQVDTGNQNYASSSGVLFSKDMKRLIQAPGAIAGSYSIPAGVTAIGGGAFFSCHHLTSVAIPSGVISIEDNALFQCSGLTGVTIPSSVTSIGVEAFSGCGALSSITMLGSTPPVLASSNAFNDNVSGFQIHVPNAGAVTTYRAAAVWREFADKIVTP